MAYSLLRVSFSDTLIRLTNGRVIRVNGPSITVVWVGNAMKKDTFILLSLLFFQCYYCSAFVASVHIAFSLCSTLDIKPFFHFYHISQSVSSLTLSPSHPTFAMLSVLSVLSILYRLSLSYSLTLALSHSVSLSVSLSTFPHFYTFLSILFSYVCLKEREW